MFSLPQRDDLRAFGGLPCTAPLLDLVNKSSLRVLLEARLGEHEEWTALTPPLMPGSSWAEERSSPLYLPRIASVRVVALDGSVLSHRSSWGEGGVLEVRDVRQ
jgi:hypothetical protein